MKLSCFILFGAILIFAARPLVAKTGKLSEGAEISSMYYSMIIINNYDTVVFDFSLAVCNPGYMDVPVYFLSDDSVYSLDFEMKFNPADFTFNSLINHKPYMNNSINYHTVDSTLRFSSFSFSPMENNTSLVSVRFNVTSPITGLEEFETIRCWLNGDECSDKGINLPPAPPIFSNGITTISNGDSLELSVALLPGHTVMWSTGATTSAIWIDSAGIYSSNVTNPQGCIMISSIVINANNPLPVELLLFEGEIHDDGIIINWITASEINSDYFVLLQRDDNSQWKEITRIPGAGFSNNNSYYEYYTENIVEGNNYFRLLQYDFDGISHDEGTIAVRYEYAGKKPVEILVFPNPVILNSGFIEIRIPYSKEPGTIRLFDLMNSEMLRLPSPNLHCSGSFCIAKLPVPVTIRNGYYTLIWKNNQNTATAPVIIHRD